LCGENGTAAHHDVSVLLLAKVGEVIEAVGRGEGELDNLKAYEAQEAARGHKRRREARWIDERFIIVAVL
jgi:hypothetical protein